MTRGNPDHGLYGVVIGAAVLLAAVVLYYVVSEYLQSSQVAGPSADLSAPAETSARSTKVNGDDSQLTATNIPPLMIHRTGRPTAPKPISSEVPLPPLSSKSKKRPE